MISIVHTASIHGIDGYIVSVETDLSKGLPCFTTVGLAEGALKESKDRVRAAIKNNGYEFPMKRITINLAPATLKKEEALFDLPIAIGILLASKQITPKSETPAELIKYLMLGELSLEGEIKPVQGVLPLLLSAKKEGFREIIIPFNNKHEASIVEGLNLFPVKALKDVIDILETGEKQPYVEIIPEKAEINSYDIDFKEVCGQKHAKRAIEIAAAGAHNVLLIGPPGSGKSMMAQRIPTILPELSFEEALETTKIYSILGFLKENERLIKERPFRAPHHTISNIALVGGGRTPRPGEMSLSHNGVLFLDELPEFKKNVLEVLRQPLEDKKVTISRALLSYTFPANCMLVSALNPCPCGHLGNPRHDCKCSENEIKRYLSKISGPLLDRIDIQVEVPAVSFEELTGLAPSESSEIIKNRVIKARLIQKNRLQKHKLLSNSQIGAGIIHQYCEIDREGTRLLKMVVEKLGFSARAYNRILKVARTIADIENSEKIKTEHLSEAIQYRCLDKKWKLF